MSSKSEGRNNQYRFVELLLANLNILFKNSTCNGETYRTVSYFGAFGGYIIEGKMKGRHGFLVIIFRINPVTWTSGANGAGVALLPFGHQPPYRGGTPEVSASLITGRLPPLLPSIDLSLSISSSFSTVPHFHFLFSPHSNVQ